MQDNNNENTKEKCCQFYHYFDVCEMDSLLYFLIKFHN